MADRPTKAQQSANNYGGLNQITDPYVRAAVKQLFDQVAHIQQTFLPTIGQVSQPLSTHLDGNGKLVRRIADPQQPEDAVNLRYLQSYVANFASALGAAGRAGGGTGTNPNAPQAKAPVDQSAIVESVRVSLGISASSTPHELFKFVQTVVWEISLLGPDPNSGALVGLLMQEGGDGVFTCDGVTYACFRLLYDNGANIKILTGSYTTQWTQEADVAVTDWHAPTDPAISCP